MIPKLTTVRDYLRFVFRRKMLLLLPALLGVLLAIPIWWFVPASYRAVATVKRKDLAVIHAAADGLLSGSGAGVPLQTLRFEILTWPRLKSVIEKLKMDVDMKNDVDWQEAYDSLQDSVEIDRKAQARGIALIEIAATDSNPIRAMEIANAIAGNYVEESQRVTRGETRSYSEFVEQQARDYLDKLRRVEDDLDEFNRKRYVELPKVKENIRQKLFDLSTSERSLQLQLTDARTRLEEVEKQLAETPMTLRSKVTSQANPDALELERKLRQYETYLEELMRVRRWKDPHPEVKKVKKLIEIAKADLENMPKRLTDAEEEVVNPAYQELTRDKMRLQQEIRAKQAAIAQTQSWTEAHQIEMRQVVNDEKRYTDLVRQKGEYEEFYQKYRRQFIAAQSRMKAEGGEYGTEVTMEAPALAPYKPYRRERLQVAFGCLAAGLALGVALMFAAEFCDQSLRSAEDAAEFLNVPIMGSVLTIVTPDELEARRQRRLILLFAIGAVVVVGVVAAIMYEHTHPGFTSILLEKVRRFISAPF